MDVLLATFQGVTIEACSTGHVGQVKVFEHLSSLVRILASSPPEFIAQYRAHTEKALQNFVMSEFSAREGLMTMPFLELIRDAFTLLYAHADSKDMLALAGDFQDAITKNKKTLPSSQSAACMYALAGISRSKGKNLSGHLVDTVSIAETTLTPRSKQTLMKIAQFAVSSMSSVTATSPALRQATVDSLVDGLIGAGEAGRSNWPNALRVLARASAVKSSVAVRESGVKGLIAMAKISPEPSDKLGSVIVLSLADTTLSVRMLAADAFGSLLGSFRFGVQWSMVGPSTVDPNAKRISLETLSWKTSVPEVFDTMLHSYHSSSSNTDFKQAISRCVVVFLDRVEAPKSVDDILAQIDWALKFASTDQNPDKTENVSLAGYILRAGIGSRAPERLQLAAARHLIDVASSNEYRSGTRRCAFIELQHLIATLGEGFSSLVDLSVKCCDAIGTENSSLLFESNALLRSLVISVPESSSTISSKWLETLVMSQADVSKIERPVRALCAIIRGASSINRGGALPSTHLFGMGKALASRHLDLDSDPTGQFGAAGWDLIDSLLTLGPSFFAPHLPQLFALWQETFRSSKNDVVLASSVNALGGLLRNANEDDSNLLGRATASLLVTIPIGFISKKSARFQASILECWSKCSSQDKQDPNMLVLALHHLTSTEAKTSFLDVGGLLNHQDEVLEFDTESHMYLADGAPADAFMEEFLFRPNASASPLECRDCFDACADLHALVGRRARSRPSLGQRVKAAAGGGSGGGSHSEATLPPSDPRAIASGQTWAQRAIDASISYFAAMFAKGDAKVKLELLNALISKYGGIPHHNSSASGGNSGTSQQQASALAAASSPKAFNVAACLLSCMRLCDSQQGFLHDREISDWQTIQRDFLLNFLSNPNAAIRRAASQAIVTFALVLASPEITTSIQMYLEGVLKSPNDDDHTNLIKCGALLTAARMKREGKEQFQNAPSESCVYEACKLTTQPVRVWSLHSWNLIVSATNPSEAHRYVRPTMALINAHLLAEAGSPTHESTSAHTATNLTLARLCNTVLSCLGPELLSDDDRATKLFAVWDILRKSNPSPDIQRQCIIFCESFALFHPKFILDDSYKRTVVSSFVLDKLKSHREILQTVFASGVTCVLRLCERDATFSKNRSRIFESMERAGRAYSNPALTVLSPTLGPWGLRFAWARNEMSGAAGPACSSRWSYFYPAEREEQVSYVVAEMIRTGGSKTLSDWFMFCREAVSGGAAKKGSGAENDDESNNNAGGDDEEAGKSSRSSAKQVVMIEDETELTMREPRWQTKTVALEGLHAVVRAARASGAEHMDLKRAREESGDEPLVKNLEALVSCAGQACTATVGDVGIATLQARGLACLSRIVTIFAPQNDPDVPEFPLLRQYEAQLNATLRPGLSPKAQTELSREATVLAANVLVTGVSTSARRLVGQLVFKGLTAEDEKEEEEDEMMFADDDDEQNESKKESSQSATASADQSSFGSVDDVSSSGLLLAKCSALARLALCAAGRAAAAFEDDVAPSDQVFREDAQSAISKALTPKIYEGLVRVWIRIVRDYFVLLASSSLRAPKRHPDATYESGRTPQDVAALLPAYAEAWMVCAQAAADAVDGPIWTGSALTDKDFQLLVFGCARAVEMEEYPIRAIDALATLISKESWKKIDPAFEKELIQVLSARALKAATRGRKPNRDACLNCISVLLKVSGSSVIFQNQSEATERLWVKVYETCSQAASSQLDVLERIGLAHFCPFRLCPMALIAVCSAARRNESTEQCGRAVQMIRARMTRAAGEDAAAADKVVSACIGDLISRSSSDLCSNLISFISFSNFQVSQPSHDKVIKLAKLCLATGHIEQKRQLIKVLGDLFRRGQTEQGRYYAKRMLEEIFTFFSLDSSTLETFKGVLEIWARIVVMGELETEGLSALALALLQDPSRGLDEKRTVAWGKFFLLVARENPMAFKTLVSQCEPTVKQVLEETVRAVMAKSG